MLINGPTAECSVQIIPINTFWYRTDVICSCCLGGQLYQGAVSQQIPMYCHLAERGVLQPIRRAHWHLPWGEQWMKTQTHLIHAQKWSGLCMFFIIFHHLKLALTINENTKLTCQICKFYFMSYSEIVVECSHYFIWIWYDTLLHSLRVLQQHNERKFCKLQSKIAALVTIVGQFNG